MSLSDLLHPNQLDGHSIQSTERARVYVRVSHERSAEKNISPETQRNLIENYARKQGYEIYSWYQEKGGASAFRDSSPRPQFDQMLRDAKADPLTTVVLVAYYDRFSRSMSATSVQEDLLRHGVRLESATEGYYDPETESGVILSGVNWSLSHLFSLKIRNRVIPCMITNFEQRDPESGWAYKNGGWAQWGYTKHRIKIGRNHKSMDIHKAVWLLDDTEVAGKPVWEWARTMLLDWRLKERLGYDSIASRLTNAGVPTPTGRMAWSNSTIQSLIGDWTRLYQYAGYAFWNREDCTDRSNRVQRDPSDWVVVSNAHPAIITEHEADAIHAMTKDMKRTYANEKGKVSSYALSGGLLKCKHCGANYSATTKNGRPYYGCGSHIYRRGAGCGSSWYIPREDAENLVFAKILAKIPDDTEECVKWVDGLNRRLAGYWDAYQRSEKDRKREIGKLEKKMSNLLDVVGAAGSSEDIKQRISDTAAALERLHRLDGIEKPATVDADALMKFRNEVAEASRSIDPQRRQIILKNLVVEIIADSETKTLSGTIVDPRAYVAEGMAVPRGVEPLSRP